MPAPACPLTVIIPFYNETAFLDMAVQSVRAQSITDIEILIVNDNPAEFGADFFAPFAGLAQVLHHDENRGLSAARNTGIRAARGRYIAFLDADDYYIAGGLEAQFAKARDTGADIVHAQCYISFAGTPQVKTLPRDRVLFAEEKIRRGLLKLEEAQFITSSWSSLYRRDFLSRNDLWFDEEQAKFEDRLFVLHAVTAARTIAQLGAPVRVWRRRANSISSSATDPYIHQLQVQLLEKCLAHMAAFGAGQDVPPRILKREIFNTVSRLIWDMDILPHLAVKDGGVYDDLGARIVRMLDGLHLGNAIFSDPIVKKISRVGMDTRKGRVRRVTFFELMRLMRDGDFAAAQKVLEGLRPASVAAKPSVRIAADLVLHLGMHKTGSTALQHHFIENRVALRKAGVWFPVSGLPDGGDRPTRDQGLPGHQGLLADVRRGEEGHWRALVAELRGAGADKVVLSCENFLVPFEEERGEILADLGKRLAMFASITPVAMVRRADDQIERMYREVVSIGHRGGARTIDEFLVDYAHRLCDLPTLFAPFETMAGRAVRLGDYAAPHGIWREFCEVAGLEAGLDIAPELGAPVYGTPTREMITAARMINATLTSHTRRKEALRGFFATVPQGGGAGRDPSLLSPKQRVELLDMFEETSGRWARMRGYCPTVSVDVMRAELAQAAWAPLADVPLPLLERALAASLRSEGESGGEPLSIAPARIAPREDAVLTVRIRPRPWVRRVIRRLKRP